MELYMMLTIIYLASLLPAAIDDLLDYLVYDLMWIPTLPIIFTSLTLFKDVLPLIFLIYLATIIIPYIIYTWVLKRFIMGGADLILYGVYVFYSPLYSYAVSLSKQSIFTDPVITYVALIIINLLFVEVYAHVEMKKMAPAVFLSLPTIAVLMALTNFI